MKQRFVVLLHAGYWTVYLLLLAVVLVVLRIQFRPAPSLMTMLFASPIGFISIAPNIVAFYFSYGVLFRRFLERQRIVGLVAAGLAGTIASAALAVVPLYLLAPGQPLFSSAGDLIGLLVWLSAVAAIHMTIALVMRGFIGWYGDIAVKEELGRKTHEVEMALIRSKLDPHFLFNSLNNIDVLIERDPSAASAYLNKLSDILRFVLYETRGDVIPLAEELAYLEKYIALERLRTRSERYVVYQVDGDPAGLLVAPMLFIPFIENAFKHTEGVRKDDAIAIHFEIAGSRVAFVCTNRRDPGSDRKSEAAGLGNELMAKRLALLYPGRHTLALVEERDTYTVRLTLDLDDTSLHHR